MALLPQRYVTFIVTLNGDWQQLNLQPSLVVNSKRTTLTKSIAIQHTPSNSNPAYVSGVTITGAAPPDSDQGIYLPAPDSSVPVAPYVIGNNSGGQNALALESVYVRGTSTQTLQICVEVYP